MLHQNDELSVFLKAEKANGLILDTCIAILFIVGISDTRQISMHEKLKNIYTEKDFKRLKKIIDIARNKYFILTPYIVTELEFNLKMHQSRGGIDRKREDIFRHYTSCLTKAKEEHFSLASLARKHLNDIGLCGIADASVVAAATRNNCAVLTDDEVLYKRLKEMNIDTILFKNTDKMDILRTSKTLKEFNIDEKTLSIFS